MAFNPSPAEQRRDAHGKISSHSPDTLDVQDESLMDRTQVMQGGVVVVRSQVNHDMRG